MQRVSTFFRSCCTLHLFVIDIYLNIYLLRVHFFWHGDIGIGTLEQELAARREELRNLETGTFDPMTAIGAYMPALVRRIRQEARQVCMALTYWRVFMAQSVLYVTAGT